MLKRLIALISSSLLIFGLTACSATENINASGAAAKSALSKVLEKSINEFEKMGGSETISVESGQYALIYDPKAVAGKRVVTADISDKNSPVFAEEKSIMLKAMPELVSSKDLEKATFNLAKGTFTIKTDVITITINTRNDLVNTTTLEAGNAGASSKQVIMTTYGISKEAKAIFDSAK